MENGYLKQRIEYLRSLGMENTYFKMAGFDPEDMERVLRLAVECGVDMVTFDGAGGGSGYSPCKMMNEWCLPTVAMESRLVSILNKLSGEGLNLPAVAVTGASQWKIRFIRLWQWARRILSWSDCAEAAWLLL